MKESIRVFISALFLLVWLAAPVLVAGAELYRYVDEKGAVRFTDDIHQVPENQRPAVAPKPEAAKPESETAPESGAPKPPTEIRVEVPKGMEKQAASMEMESVLLSRQKKDLDTEFMEIIAERDRLEKERSIPGGPAETKAYNDAVFALKDRIAAYQKRCDDYEARVKALNDRVKSLQ